MEHFGVRFYKKPEDLHISKENFIGRKKDGRYYYKSRKAEEWYESDQSRIEQQVSAAKMNYDLNMRYYEMLDHDEFEEAIRDFLKHHRKFVVVDDLTKFDMPGAYLMVLDEFKQGYIGISETSILRRIKQHWAIEFYLDRILFGGVNNSRLSINCFRALDTTRIYAMPTSKGYSIRNIENYLVDSLPDKFSCNRTAGGLTSLLDSIVNAKSDRNLSSLKEQNHC